MESSSLLFLLYCGTSVTSVTSGDSFRDPNTLPAARYAARFQEQKQKDLNTHFQRWHEWSWCDDNLKLVSRYEKRLRHSSSSSTPTFMHSSRHRPASLLSDFEIFDFTDSRLIRPPPENGINFPTLKARDVDNFVDNVSRVRIFYSYFETFPTKTKKS